MPWKEYSVMEERLRFVARLLEGESMTDVCREFGVSRKTGYKVFDRGYNMDPSVFYSGRCDGSGSTSSLHLGVAVLESECLHMGQFC